MKKKNNFFKMAVFIASFLIGLKAQAMLTESEETRSSQHTPAKAIFNFSPDYKDEINITSSFFIACNKLKKIMKSENELQEISTEYIKLANKYAMTDGYQTKKLRKLSNKNLIQRCIWLQASCILSNTTAQKLWEDDRESKEYSYENYNAFLAVDEDNEKSGKKYSDVEEKEIKNFFLSHFNYMKRIEELASSLSKE